MIKNKKKKYTNFPLKHGWKTRSVQSRAEKNSQEKREYGELFTKNIGSGENTSGRKGGKICFGIMRLQTLRNSVSPNFIHFSHWIHGDTVHNLYPPHRWRQPRYTVSTRCPVYSSIPVSRGRKRNTEFEGGEKGYRRRRNTKEEGREKPLGTRGVQTVSSSSSSSSRDSSRNFHFVLARCSFLAELFDPTESPGNASVWFSRMLRKVDRLIVSRKGIGDDCRAVLHLVQFTPREIIKSWTWHENEEICLIFIYACGIEKAKGGSWIWLFFEIIYDCSETSENKWQRDTSFLYFSIIALTNPR